MLILRYNVYHFQHLLSCIRLYPVGMLIFANWCSLHQVQWRLIVHYIYIYICFLQRPSKCSALPNFMVIHTIFAQKKEGITKAIEILCLQTMNIYPNSVPIHQVDVMILYCEKLYMLVALNEKSGDHQIVQASFLGDYEYLYQIPQQSIQQLFPSNISVWCADQPRFPSLEKTTNWFHTNVHVAPCLITTYKYQKRRDRGFSQLPFIQSCDLSTKPAVENN